MIPHPTSAVPQPEPRGEQRDFPEIPPQVFVSPSIRSARSNESLPDQAEELYLALLEYFEPGEDDIDSEQGERASIQEPAYKSFPFLPAHVIISLSRLIFTENGGN